MSSSTHPLTVDAAEHTFSLLAGMVDGLVSAWEAATEPPRLGDFLPEDAAARHLVLIELIKVDLEYRWQHRNLPKHIGQYVAEFPELAEGGVPPALIYEEFHIRRNCGFAVDAWEYIRQYPDQADELQRLLGLEEVYESTAVYRPMGKEALQEISAGDTVDDFDLLAPLGQGAFAKVFLARQRSMQRLVALKVSADSGREPQMLAQFDHENIVRVYDHRIEKARGLRLLYMQYCPGGTLRQVVRTAIETDPAERTGEVLLRTVKRLLEHRGESPPPDSDLTARLRSSSWPETVCWIGARLAEALDYSHSRGVLHRDLKPANVLLSREGVPKLADFNISCSSKLEGASPAAYFGGSLAYMSVEQLEASNPRCDRDPAGLDGRSDQFSLGVVLWELLTGQRPYADKPVSSNWSKTLAEMADRRRAGIDREARDRVPADCPPGLVHVLERCLAPDPDDRWSGGKELARQLDLCRDRAMQELLNPAPSSWPLRLRRFSVPAVILAAAVPNLLAGAFNLAYNKSAIVDALGESQQHAFWRTMTIVNSLAYPLGLGLLAVLAIFVVRVIRRLGSGEAVSGPKLRAASRWCLSLGHAAAVIGVVEWTIAGLAYPLAIHLAAGKIGAADYAHFLGSLVLCGLVSAAYPFFGVTCIAVRVLYPQLLEAEIPGTSENPRNLGGGDVHLLERLNQRCWFYLVLAVSVPLASVLILAAIQVPARFPLLWLSGGTLVGFGVIYWCFRRLQADLATLLAALSPGKG